MKKDKVMKEVDMKRIERNLNKLMAIQEHKYHKQKEKRFIVEELKQQ